MKLDELKAKLDAIPGYRQAYERQFPDAEASLAICRGRARRDLTQEQFAKLLRISVAAVRRLESANWDAPEAGV